MMIGDKRLDEWISIDRFVEAIPSTEVVQPTNETMLTDAEKVSTLLCIILACINYRRLVYIRRYGRNTT
jgi:hypothetical protein